MSTDKDSTNLANNEEHLHSLAVHQNKFSMFFMRASQITEKITIVGSSKGSSKGTLSITEFACLFYANVKPNMRYSICFSKNLDGNLNFLYDYERCCHVACVLWNI